MNFLEFLAPIFRRKFLTFFLILFLGGGFFGLSFLIPESEKTTIFFSVKIPENEKNFSLDPTSSAARLAEMIVGWAKNPSFREKILKLAAIPISNFRKKISARQQNSLNVIFSLKFSGAEKKFSRKIANALVQNLRENIDEINAEKNFQIKISPPQIFSKIDEIPLSWRAAAAIFFGIFFGIFAIFLLENSTGKIIFPAEIAQIFPTARVLKISEKFFSAQRNLAENFVATFDSPQIISTFAGGEKFFSAQQNLNLTKKNIIFLIKLGATKIADLENFRAICGENVGIIIFEK